MDVDRTFIVFLLIAIFAHLTPYPWWQDAMVVYGIGLLAILIAQVMSTASKAD